MTVLSGRKPILCLDFDGVCHSYTSGWKGAAVIPDPPVDGLFEFLEHAEKVFEVNVFSSRTSQGGTNAMLSWFMDHADRQGYGHVVPLLRFPTEKPPAFVGIDDRVITFTGKWPKVEDLLAFQPWNKLGVSGDSAAVESGTELHPRYSKVEETPAKATRTFMITCDEGWRESIVCSGMYEWAADWLLEQIQGKPYASSRGTHAGEVQVG